MLCLCFKSAAHAAYTGTWGNLTWSLNTGSGTLSIHGTGEMNDFASGSSGGWHAYNDLITFVNIDSGITSIGHLAFYGCENLVEASIPSSVTKIGNLAFNGCSSMDQLFVPGSVTEIGRSAFGRCTALNTIVLSQKLTAISEGMFNRCTSLNNITIPNGVTSIGSQAFENCSGLKRIDLPASVQTIEDWAFAKCENLTGIWANANSAYFQSDSYGVLYSKDGSKLIAAPGGLTGSYHIPDTVTSIASGAFTGCAGLTDVSLSKNVSIIPSGMFSDCRLLESVTIPYSVKTVDSQAFSQCESLTDVYYDGYSFQTIHIDANYNEALTNATVHIISGFGNVYNLFWMLDENGVLTISGSGEMDDRIAKNSIAWRDYGYSSKIQTVIIEPGVTSISASAFGYLSITSVSIPNTVTMIDHNAFENCRALTGIVIPDSVSVIGHHAFAGCDGITSIAIPGSVTSIGDGAFADCAALTGIWASGSSRSFYSDSKGILYSQNQKTLIQVPGKLSGELLIPDSVTTIKAEAFRGCENLSVVVLQAGVIDIGDEAFHDCGIKSISIPSSLTTVGYAAFLCGLLTDVYYEGTADEWNTITIGNDNSKLENAEFHFETLAGGSLGNNLSWVLDCDGLLTISGNGPMENFNDGSDGAWRPFIGAYITGVIIEEGVTTVGNYAFEDLNNDVENTSHITTVSLPSTVTEIGEAAFILCDRLTDIRLPDGLESIGESAFEECTGLTEITIPGSVASIGDYAFNGCADLSNVYYGGTRAEWDAIVKGTYNNPLTTATIHFGRYSIQLADLENGSIEITVNGEPGVTAAENDTVTLTAAPDAGYELDTLTVKQGENDVAVTDNSFAMPAGDVTVTAVFVPRLSEWQALQNEINRAAEADEESAKTVVLDKDYTALDTDAALVIPALKTVTIDLNGHTIDRGLSSGPAIDDGNVITSYGDLTIKDSSTGTSGRITGGNTNGDGGGIICSSGSFTLQGGQITGNKAGSRGGGIFISSVPFTISGGSVDNNDARIGGGLFAGGSKYYQMGYITGGSISQNTASDLGGGIAVNACMGVEMSDGVISYNSAANGGGAAVCWGENRGFTLLGGSIENNSAVNEGGGVCLRSLSNKKSSFYACGGSITDNTANDGGGVAIDELSAIQVSGSVTITGNKAGSGNDTEENNVSMDRGQAVKISGTLDPEARIGISVKSVLTPENPMVITEGLNGNGSESNFISDNEGYAAVLDADLEAMLAVPLHITMPGESTLGMVQITDINGTPISAAPDFVLYNDIITLTISPAEKYGLAENGLSVTYIDENNVQQHAELTQGTGQMSNTWSFTMPAADVTVDASFELKAFTITFDANGGTDAPEVQTKTKGTALYLSSDVPTRDGWDFLGWATAADATAAEYQPGDSYTAEGNAVLYAVWQLKTYEISYNANGGENAPETQRKTHGSAIILTAETPTREEHVESIRITLNANGGTVSPRSLTATLSTSYDFENWNTLSDGSGKTYVAGDSYTDNADITLYAQWAESTEESPASLPTPMRDGFIFKGWGSSEDDTEGVTGYYMPAKNVTLYAIWEEKTYTISYNANGGADVPEDQIKKYSENLVLTDTIPTNVGAYFLGWAESAEAAEPVYLPGDSYTKNENITLYAVWARPDFVLPAALTEVGEEAFAGGAFTFVKLSDNTASIGRRAFADCLNLRYIYIPTATTSIDPDAFGSMQNLTIFGYAGSVAEKFAADNEGVTFIALA